MKNWKDIEEWVGLYQVNDLGDVKSLHYHGGNNERLLKQFISDKTKKYKSVRLWKCGRTAQYFVHRLVARAFPEICGEWFDGCEVDHLDGNPQNNEATNLQVKTHKENCNNKITLERKSIARKGKCFTPTKSVIQIIDNNIINTYNSIAEAAEKTGINQSHISQVCQGKRKSAGGSVWKYNV